MMPTVGKLNMADVTIGWIRNSLDLRYIGFTENLLPQIEANPALEMLTEPTDWPFDSRGDLPALLRCRNR